MAAGGYPREMSSCRLTGVREASSSILHSTYATLVVSIGASPCGPGSGVLPAPAGPFLYPTPLLYKLCVYLSTIVVIFCEDRWCKIASMEVNVERLKELRRERVLSLRELEEKSGVSYNTIWRLEDGRQGAHPRTMRKLAEALGVEPKS